MRYAQTYRMEYTAILDMLRGIRETYNKHKREEQRVDYCYPSQVTIKRLLKKYHGIEASLRTINRWLRRMEDMGLIYRQRRLTRGKFMSTAYYILERSKHTAARVRKTIGYAKRLSKIFKAITPENRVPSLAEDMSETDRDMTDLEGGGPSLRPPTPIKGVT